MKKEAVILFRQRAGGRCEPAEGEAGVRFRSRRRRAAGSAPYSAVERPVSGNLGGNAESFRPIWFGNGSFLFCASFSRKRGKQRQNSIYGCPRYIAARPASNRMISGIGGSARQYHVLTDITLRRCGRTPAAGHAGIYFPRIAALNHKFEKIVTSLICPPPREKAGSAS